MTLLLCNSEFTHGNTHNYKKMRTKALLSVAAIAASAISAVAQNVYSLNIVGYATVPLLPGYNLVANPLSAGVTNGANELGLTIESEQILTWSGTGFNYVSFDSGFGGWIDANFAASHPPSLPPGTGFFFYNPGATTTNFTFVGQVVPNPSSTNNLSLKAGYSLIGSPLPAAVTDISAAPVSLPKIDSMQVLTWDNTTSKYVYTAYDSGFGGWIDANFAAKPAPSYAIGQGFFFYNPQPTAANWAQSLP
jgi:hypothetical protein